MKILIDTNILISYLLHSDRPPIQTVMQLVFDQKVTLLLPEDLLDEVAEVVQRPSLAKYIVKEDVEILIKTLRTVSILMPRITQPLPRITADPKDDYLLAYAVLYQADYLLTGDKKHLLPLSQIGVVKIVTPTQFLQEGLD